MIGSPKDRDDFFEERLNKLQALQEDLADIEDAGIELLLGRLCANTTKISHLLRAHGCHINPQLLSRFDESKATFVGRVLAATSTQKPLNKLLWDSTMAALASERRTSWRPRRTWPLLWKRAPALHIS